MNSEDLTQTFYNISCPGDTGASHLCHSLMFLVLVVGPDILNGRFSDSNNV